MQMHMRYNWLFLELIMAQHWMVIAYLWITNKLPLNSLWVSGANTLHWIINVNRSPIEIWVSFEWIRYELGFWDYWASIEFQMNCYRMVLPAKPYNMTRYAAGLIENPISCHSKSWIRTHSNPESRIQDPEPRIIQKRIWNLWFVQNPEFEIWNPASVIWNPESRIRNPDPRIQNPASGIQNPEPRTQNSESGIRNLDSLQSLESRLWKPGSGVPTPEPGIQNYKSWTQYHDSPETAFSLWLTLALLINYTSSIIELHLNYPCNSHMIEEIAFRIDNELALNGHWIVIELSLSCDWIVLPAKPHGVVHPHWFRNNLPAICHGIIFQIYKDIIELQACHNQLVFREHWIIIECHCIFIELSYRQNLRIWLFVCGLLK